MWDRSYRWQRLARLCAGALTVAAAGAGVYLFSLTDQAARAAEGVAEIRREASPKAEERVQCAVPRSLSVRPGVLVHLERDDGAAEIVGRVIRVEPLSETEDEVTILLTPTAVGVVNRGGVLKGAEPTVSLEQAVRLLLAPSIPRDEAAIARDMIWPAVDEHVLPGLTTRLEDEVAAMLNDMGEDDSELLSETLDDVHEELAPFEEELLGKLADRAWEVVGVGGVVEGIGRKTADAAEDGYDGAKRWVKGIFGGDEEPEEDESDRGFLSDERKQELREALEEETKTYWEDHKDEIQEKIGKVLAERRSDFVEAWNERWAPDLYEKAVVPAWFDGEEKVIAAAEAYAKDFASRRLLTSEGGPRLLLAFALRSALSISDEPLLVLAPNPASTASSTEDADRRPTVVYQALVPRLESDD